jgi:hypothetical protein
MRSPRTRVGEASDEEEDRNHLESPSEPIDPRQRVEGTAPGGKAILESDVAHQPVADDHRAEGGNPEEVDIAMAFGRGPIGQPRRPL